MNEILTEPPSEGVLKSVGPDSPDNIIDKPSQEGVTSEVSLENSTLIDTEEGTAVVKALAEDVQSDIEEVVNPVALGNLTDEARPDEEELLAPEEGAKDLVAELVPDDVFEEGGVKEEAQSAADEVYLKKGGFEVLEQFQDEMAEEKKPLYKRVLNKIKSWFTH